MYYICTYICLNVLTYERMYVFLVILTINIYYFPTQYVVISLRNVQRLCSLCSRNLVLQVIWMNVSLRIVRGCTDINIYKKKYF